MRLLLKNNDLKGIQGLPKSDLHNHSTRGGAVHHFVPSLIPIQPKAPVKLKDMAAMQHWYEANIKQYFQGRKGFEMRIRSAFLHAQEDGIQKLAMSFGLGDSMFYPSQEAFITAIKKMQQAYRGVFIPEIAFSRSQNPIEAYAQLEALIKFDFFKAIDLFGDEYLGVTHFKQVFELATEAGMIKKAHVGEFGTAEMVKEAVEILELDQVQHGIAAATSPDVMAFLREEKIMLNICPSSNVILDRVKDYASHPIKQLHEQGVKVTINTDDMLIFNQSVSQEYLNLYQDGTLDAEALECIRQNGLED